VVCGSQARAVAGIKYRTALKKFGRPNRTIKGSEMVDFNPIWTFHLAMALTKIDGLHAGKALFECGGKLVEANSSLQAFVAHEQNSIFPETLDRVRDVVGLIEALVSHPPNKCLAQAEVLELDIAINHALITFEAESERVFIVGLQRQRALDLRTLVESIKDCVSRETWDRMSAASRRELGECGRCLALERYTAAGFHALRAIEVEIRDYVCLLLHARPEKRDWGYYVQVLRDHSANPKLVSTLDEIRKLDRNPLMHPEDWLEQGDAIGLFNSAQTSLERLIADMRLKKLLPPAPSV